MKKAIALLATLVVLTTTAFAEATVSVGGTMKTIWGVDLDESQTGFESKVDGFTVTINNPVDKDGKSSEGENVYGEVSVSGIEIYADTGWNNGNTGNAENPSPESNSVPLFLRYGTFGAKLYLGPVTIGMYDGWGTKTSGTNGIDLSGANSWSYYLQNAYEYDLFDGAYGQDNSTAAVAHDDTDWAKDYFAPRASKAANFSDKSVHGVNIGYALDGVADFTVGINSNGDWTKNKDNEYNGKFAVNVTAVDGLTLNGAVATGLYDDSDVTFGAKLGYDVKAGDDITITPIFGLDGNNYAADNKDLGLALAGGVKADVMDSVLTVYFGKELTKENKDADDDKVDVTAALTVGTIDNLTLQAAVESLGNSETLGIHSKVGYDIAVGDITVKPSVGFSYHNKTTVTTVTKAAVPAVTVDLVGTDGETYAHELKAEEKEVTTTTVAKADDYKAYVQAGVDIEGLVANTVFSLGWDSNDLNTDDNTLGRFTTTVAVSF